MYHIFRIFRFSRNFVSNKLILSPMLIWGLIIISAAFFLKHDVKGD